MYEKKLIQYEERLERIHATMNSCIDGKGNIIKGDLLTLALSQAKELLSECNMDKSNYIEANINGIETPLYNEYIQSFNLIIKTLKDLLKIKKQ